jgi:hypothetical protein
MVKRKTKGRGEHSETRASAAGILAAFLAMFWDLAGTNAQKFIQTNHQAMC